MKQVKVTARDFVALGAVIALFALIIFVNTLSAAVI